MQYKTVCCIIFLLLISLSFTSIIEGKFQIYDNLTNNGFSPKSVSKFMTPEDEGDHFPCGWELWCIHALLMLENGEQWDAAACLTYNVNKTRKGYEDGVAYSRVRHWNRQTGKFYDDFQKDTFPGIMKTEKNKVNVTYNKNYIRGLYPNYEYHCEDDTNNITINMILTAKSDSCWLYKDSTGGNLPWGISGVGKAYFIPLIDVTGNITFNDTTHNFTGVAYHEHDIGFFDFSKPYQSVSFIDTMESLKAQTSRYIWWRQQVRKNEQKDHTFSTHLSNDYLFGWNWGWIVLDNNFNIVMFNPTFFGLYQGNVPAFIYFTKDGKNYIEIGCVTRTIKKEIYIENADVYIPIEFEIRAYKDDIEIFLSFVATTEITELYSMDFAEYYEQHGGTFFECGDITGYYKDDESNISLNGFYQLDQTRWLPKFRKHKSYDMKMLLPPNGLSYTIRKVNHRFGFERYLKIQIRPKLDVEFYIKRLSN